MTLNDFSSLAVSVARYGRGYYVAGKTTHQPEATLELYDMERCPYCRKVREALSELDLEYIARTSTRGAATRQQAVALGGKQMFPLLSDPNTGKLLYESEDIIDYLWATYGGGRKRLGKLVAPLNTASSMLASALRARGGKAETSTRVQPAELLVLYSFEASPYCRKVREVLGELDLHHHIENVAKKSTRRPELVALGGKMQVPYLIDPNTQTALYESEDIIAYLRKTYG